MTDSYEELDWWLESATSGLCDDAKARIREEVSAHYEDARGDAFSRGLSDRDALDEALLSLGHPNTALRQFRMQHLTTAEQRRLKRETRGEGGRRKAGFPMYFVPGNMVFATMCYGCWRAGKGSAQTQ